MKSLLMAVIGCATSVSVFCQTPPALNTIKKEDLKTDLYALAGADFKGRGAGTINELNASSWIAEKFRGIGLLPAGDYGSYIQFFNMWRNRASLHSTILINNKRQELWKQVAVAQVAPFSIDAPILFLGMASALDKTLDIKGKVVAVEAVPGIMNYRMSLPSWRYQRNFMTQFGNDLIARGAAAIILIGDAETDVAWADAVENFKQGTFDLEGGPNSFVRATVPVLWFHSSSRPDLIAGARITCDIAGERFNYPSANIVGIVKGTDPVLSKEYVLFSGHTDAHGIRNVIDNDSIFYGADDNASVDVAMFAIARAFKKNPAKRSVIFVIHGAEERGLLGSRWFSSHPTVALESIIAVLNGDMIGRNHPDSAALMGATPPHLNSADLARMAIEANNEGPKFKLDFSWDNATHPEFWYFRSDHLPYARLGIPAVYYSSLLHADYHTPRDSPANIDYDKLKKMTEWIYRIGWKAANAPVKPNREPNFALER